MSDASSTSPPATIANPGSRRVLHASKAKWRAVLLVALAFVAIGLIMIATKSDFLSWFITLAFAVVAGVAFLQMNGNGLRLILDADTFTFTNIGRADTTERWDRCADFTVYRVSDSEQVVYDTTRYADTHIGEMNRSLTGRSAALPDTFDLSAEDLANLMNAYQAAAVTRSWQHHAEAVTGYKSMLVEQLKSPGIDAEVITDPAMMDLPADMPPWPTILVAAKTRRPDGTRHILQLIDILSPSSVWIDETTKTDQAFNLLGADELQLVDPVTRDVRSLFPDAT